MYDSEEEWYTDEEKIATIAEEYYKQLFTSSNSLDMKEMIDSVDKVVTENMAQDLIRLYVADEVKTTLFQMHPSKAPGPNGMSPIFFQKFWHIVRHDVTTIVLSVLHSRRYLRKMNYTHIVLILKKKEPEHITEFHRISLGNVVSRIISKVLANRLKPILPNVISDSQSAFVPGRIITDNTTVAFEMFHHMRNKTKRKQ